MGPQWLCESLNTGAFNGTGVCLASRLVARLAVLPADGRSCLPA